MPIEIDTSKLTQGINRLTSGIELGSKQISKDTASNAATSLRASVPVRTGALRATVQVVEGGFSYGGGLRYAKFYTDVLDEVTQQATDQFNKAMLDMATREVKGI